MNAITYSYARENLSSTITDVCLNHDPIIITKKGTDAVVMISLEDFESMQETAYLLKSLKMQNACWKHRNSPQVGTPGTANEETIL